jgi:hypothetical protein
MGCHQASRDFTRADILVRRSARLNELLQKWTEEYNVVINEDNLKKVHLPARREDAERKLMEERQEKAQEKKADASKG